MESRVYWDKQFMELERVKKNLVEMEKVILEGLMVRLICNLCL